jgi:hypothetical protein
MNGQEFVEVLKTVVRDNAVSGELSVLRNPPAIHIEYEIGEPRSICHPVFGIVARRSLPASAISGASMMRWFSATSARIARAGRTTIRRTCGIEYNQLPHTSTKSDKKGRSLPAPPACAGDLY